MNTFRRLFKPLFGVFLKDAESNSPRSNRLPNRPPNRQLEQIAGAAITLDQTHVRDIMVPRSETVFVYEDEKIEDLQRRVVESGFTRLPMADVDEQKILGILHAKDLLKTQHSGNSHALKDLVRPVVSVPESMRASALLERLRRQHAHMAAVVDEYGGIAGIVTLEDVIEELVGEIEDEHEKSAATPSVEATAGGWIAPGNLPIADFNHFFNAKLEDPEADTLGGYVLNQLSRVPRPAEILPLDKWELVVEAVGKGRIQRLKIRHAPAPDGPEARPSG